jgi:deoxyadenosine/deoxycytidine kinase
MKEAFVEAIVMDGPTVPTVLKSGVGNSTMAHTLSTTTEAKTGFERVAEDLFCKKGLSFMHRNWQSCADWQGKLSTLSGLSITS